MHVFFKRRSSEKHFLMKQERSLAAISDWAFERECACLSNIWTSDQTAKYLGDCDCCRECIRLFSYWGFLELIFILTHALPYLCWKDVLEVMKNYINYIESHYYDCLIIMLALYCLICFRVSIPLPKTDAEGRKIILFRPGEIAVK